MKAIWLRDSAWSRLGFSFQLCFGLFVATLLLWNCRFAHAQKSQTQQVLSGGSGLPFQLSWEPGPTGSKASFRGLAAASPSVIWLSGSLSTVLRSDDGGNSWSDRSPEGYGDLEFRSIHAWDEQRCCVASAGNPAVILLTQNGGHQWREVYRAESEKAFFDGLKFWDEQRGIAFSDPVDETLLIVQTEDGGTSWEKIAAPDLPKALDGEAGFAASNSSMAIGPKGQVWIGTGGAEAATSRVWLRPGFNAAWSVKSCPIASAATHGIFSIACEASDDAATNEAAHTPRLVAVGGDYRPGVSSSQTACWSDDGGDHWSLASTPPPAYRSAVVSFRNSPRQFVWIAAGPTGSDVSLDGENWWQFSKSGFHTLVAVQGTVFGAGAEGKFAKLKIE